MAEVPITARPSTSYPTDGCWEGETASPAWGAGCRSWGLGLPCQSQLMSRLPSVASNSICLQQHTAYLCTKQHSFRGESDPEILPGSPRHADNGEEASQPLYYPYSFQ